MKSMIFLLALAFATPTTASLAQPRPPDPYDDSHAARFVDPAAAYEYPEWNRRSPDWYRRWQLHRLYHQREGYLPDYRVCFPGACRDNPYY